MFKTPEFEACHLELPMISINSRTVFRLILSAILVVHKFYTDLNYCNSYFAEITGWSLESVNQMERQFLYIIDFDLVVDDLEFESYTLKVNEFFNESNQEVLYQIGLQIQAAIHREEREEEEKLYLKKQKQVLEKNNAIITANISSCLVTQMV